MSFHSVCIDRENNKNKNNNDMPKLERKSHRKKQYSTNTLTTQRKSEMRHKMCITIELKTEKMPVLERDTLSRARMHAGSVWGVRVKRPWVRIELKSKCFSFPFYCLYLWWNSTLVECMWFWICICVSVCAYWCEIDSLVERSSLENECVRIL